MTREPVVIDSSVALALILDEPEASEVIRAIGSWTKHTRPLVVPSHFWLEVMNRMGRDRGAPGLQMLEAVHRLDTLGLETVEPGRPMLIHAIDAMERHGLTAYDAVYLVLAESLDAQLATFDRELAAAAGRRAVTFAEGHKLDETPAVYERAVTWPRYKGASAYLAKLRAEALAERA